ncbi:MFS transporter [Novosphingobium sp. JCM 18896]|uniref:MFS transporter n=1 Tax=Novosphingobium sp. JCM 18896 TaxID=2989731 RepID=UPI0022228933|nr:MFS transporter [Novosphingobium sp. JCM 18896]MCW1428416.1 MFS transporter [Novosphingobium sp. JCM 18896]
MRRAVAAATLGNALEFYDFVAFAFFAVQIGKAFFPSGDPFLSLMGSLATFGAGFVSRPLGAWVLGGYADRHGRKPAMLASMLLMGGGIALLALTPSYQAIGLAAPVLAVIARLIQGFALGGEIGSATTYLVEAADEHRRGLVISLQGASQAVAALTAALVGLALSLVLSEAALAAYGWRIALLLGTVIVPFALIVRRALPETLRQVPIAASEAPASHRRTVLCGLAMIGAGTTGTYVFTYMATFGQNTLKFPPSVALTVQALIGLMQVIATLLGGWLSDRFGRRPMLIWPASAFVCAVVPCFAWIDAARDATTFVTAMVLLASLSFLTQASIYATISEGLPTRIRARGFALIYALPVALIGGATQLVVTWLLEVTGTPMALAWYLTGTSLIGLVAMILVPETAPVRRSFSRA